VGITGYEKRQKLLGYVFLLPTFLFLAVFMFYPLAKSIVMSFTNWTGINDDFKFTGLNNYIRLFTNTPEYWNGIIINFKFAIITTLIQTTIGFLLAFIVYYMTKKWQNFYKVSLYIPVILPAAVIAVMWAFIFSPEYGLLNQFLRLIGLGKLAIGWLGDPRTALASIVVVNTWQYVGFTMVLYYIAMLNISKDILESAAADGASKWVLLKSFFMPLTMNTTEINVILSLTGGMKTFALFYMMTGGGPGRVTQVASMVIYDTAFVNFDFARALTMSTVLFLIILVLMIASRKLMQKEDI